MSVSRMGCLLALFPAGEAISQPLVIRSKAAVPSRAAAIRSTKRDLGNFSTWSVFSDLQLMPSFAGASTATLCAPGRGGT